MNKLLFLITVSVIISCGESLEDTMDYKPLSGFSNDTSLIQDGDEVLLYAFSGGKQDDAENMYYQQILAINIKTGDTLSILCPQLKIPGDEGMDGYMFVSPLEFNPDHQIRQAFYERTNDTIDMVIQAMSSAVVMARESDDAEEISFEKLSKAKKRLVTVNNRLPAFKTKHKTVVGLLRFESDIR